jgi:hypothetical protein
VTSRLSRAVDRGEEALEQQPVYDGFGGDDEQRVVDHGAGAARRDPDPQRPGVRDDLGHG